MNILILNWRDIKNPSGGGAELLTHELAKGWVKAGNQVLVLSSKFLGAKENETLNGVNFVRRGRWWTVHVHALFFYLKNRNRFDIVIDEVHWFPFFAKLYAGKKTIALTCETATKLFPKLFPPVISHAFQLIEKLYFILYRNVPTMTISESSKNDLIQKGINRKMVTVLPMGINIPKSIKKYPKEKDPTFIYLARLNKQKGIFDAIEAFAIINKQKSVNNNRKSILNHKSSIISPILWVVGSGDENILNEVKEKVRTYKLEPNVKFFGFVTEQKKFELLARAHILLVPSAHEGWGLTVPEASSQKTPAIVYNVSGLSDIVESEKTGIIVRKNTPEELSKEAVKLLRNKNLYKKLQVEGLKKIEEMGRWEKAVKKSLSLIKTDIM